MGKRIIAQRRGRGSVFKSPSHRHKADVEHPKARLAIKGVVKDIIHDPARTAPLALVEFEDGDRASVIAPEGIAVGEEIEVLSKDVAPGNVVTLRNVPEGTPVFNIESQPGDGGKFVRSAGTNAVIVSSDPSKVVVRLPSGALKQFQPQCRATIGIVAGGGRGEKPLAKAGKSFHKFRSRGRKFPRVSGVAMNPVDHPHGGGNKQHVGQPGTAGKNAPPGRKVGSIAAKRTGKK